MSKVEGIITVIIDSILLILRAMMKWGLTELTARRQNIKTQKGFYFPQSLLANDQPLPMGLWMGWAIGTWQL